MTQQEFFNRYQYKPSSDKLGGGSFGKVYKAYDTVLDKYVALKVAEQIEAAGKVFSLLDEFKALENIPDHVNIAKYEQLYTYESPQGVFDYAIMQYYPDGNLSQLIMSQNLSSPQKENLAIQLLNGIGFLHSHKVVHRDMKPSNILIHNRVLNGTKEYIPKITDFGLSKKTKTDKGTHFTNSIAAGTYAYSSPEQLKGEELRFNTDLWAYGAIVYELFTGKTMFNIQKTSTGSSAIEVQEILDNILKNDITTKVKELPEKWQPVVTACLERDAQKRVKTADAVMDILHGKTQAQPIEEPISTAETTNTPETQILEKPKPQKMAETQVLEKENIGTLGKDEKKKSRTGLWVSIGVGVLALMMMWIFWPKKQTATSSILVVDSTGFKKNKNIQSNPNLIENSEIPIRRDSMNIKPINKLNNKNFSTHNEVENGKKSLPQSSEPYKQITIQVPNSKIKTNMVDKTESNSKIKNEYSEKYGIIILKPNTTIYGLTKIFNISEDELRKLNPDLENNFKIGSEIKLPLENINNPRYKY